MRRKYSYTTFCSVIDDPQCANIIIYHKQTLASGDIITYNLYVVWLRMLVRKYQAYAEILIIEFSGNETGNACHTNIYGIYTFITVTSWCCDDVSNR